MKFLMNRLMFGMLIILPLFAIGCASPYLLSKQRSAIEFKPGEGAVLISGNFHNRDNPKDNNVFWANSITLQEVNQYKSFSQKRLLTIPCPRENYLNKNDVFLFPLKLQKGTYRIVSQDGYFRTFFATNYFASVNKIFDVFPGRISYGGRIGVSFYPSGWQQSHEITTEDMITEDLAYFKSEFPALENRDIIKDLMY